MKDLLTVEDKVIAITGGGGVLCGAIAKALAREGAKVALLNRTLEKAQKVADEIKASGGSVIALQCDALDKQALETACTTTEETLGPVDILINGAGGNKKEATTTPELSFFDLPQEAIQYVFDVNFLSALLTTQVFAQSIAKRGEGSILNISSMNAFQPLTKIPAYSAAKAALSNFTQWLAVHMCQNYSPKIRVNALSPGFFLTEQNRFLLTDEKTSELTPRGKSIIDNTPMGRFGSPEDLVSTVLWLLSDSSSFVTGVVVPVDGGFSAFSGV